MIAVSPNPDRQHCSGCEGIGAVRVTFRTIGGSSYFALCRLCARDLMRQIGEQT